MLYQGVLCCFYVYQTCMLHGAGILSYMYPKNILVLQVTFLAPWFFYGVMFTQGIQYPLVIQHIAIEKMSIEIAAFLINKS